MPPLQQQATPGAACSTYTLQFTADPQLERAFVASYNNSFRRFDFIWNLISLLLALGLASKLPDGIFSKEGALSLMTQAGRLVFTLAPYFLTAKVVGRRGDGSSSSSSSTGSSDGGGGGGGSESSGSESSGSESAGGRLRLRATLRMVCLSLLKGLRVFYPFFWEASGGYNAGTSCEGFKLGLFELTVSYFFGPWVYPTPFCYDAPIHIAAFASELLFALPRTTGLCARISGNPQCGAIAQGFRSWTRWLNTAGAVYAPELLRVEQPGVPPAAYCRATLGFGMAACATLPLYAAYGFEAAHRRRFLRHRGLPDSGVPRVGLGAAEAVALVTAVCSLWVAIALATGLLRLPEV